MKQDNRRIILTETDKDVDIEYFVKGNDDRWVKTEPIDNIKLKQLFTRVVRKTAHQRFKPDQIGIRDRDTIRIL